MKTQINLVLVAVIAITGLIIYSGGCSHLAQQKDLLEVKKELYEHRQEFKAEMQILHLDTDSLKAGQKKLGAGQKVLLKAVKQTNTAETNKTFADDLINFLN